MNGSGKVTLNASVEKAWDVLLDPQALKNCIMGCTKLESIEENKYEALLSIGIAAVKGKYESIIEIADAQKPNHYKLIVKGEGGPGSVEAVGAVDLVPVDENKTELRYKFDAEVGGKVAMVGQRMLSGVAKLIIQDFFKKFNKELAKSGQSV